MGKWTGKRNPGHEKIGLYSIDQRQKRIVLYDKKPKRCEYCNQALPYDKRHCKFCNHSCSASYTNHGVRRNYSHGKYAPKSCSFCGTTSRNPKYCSGTCERASRWELKKKDIEVGKVNGPPTLRRYLTEKHGHQCSICDNTEWRGKPTPLVLDHINGNPYDNQVKNLRLICPNCDAQTDTYTGRNRGNGRHYRRERYRLGKSY